MGNHHPLSRYLLGLGLACCCAPAVFAQRHAVPTAAPGVSRFPAGYFSAWAPVNAWDMVQHLPGFAAQTADEDIRGYAEARGNVLIDGARPTSKYEDIEDVLKRIPARSVQRIELIRTSADGIDLGKYAVVANVVLVPKTTSNLTVQSGAMASTDGWIAPIAQIQYARNRDDRRLRAALQYEPDLDDDSGYGTRRRVGPDGHVTGVDSLGNRTTENKSAASIHWKSPLAAGTLILNGALRGEKDRIHTRYVPRNGGDTETVSEREDVTGSEVGARYTRPLGQRSTLDTMLTWRLGRDDDREHSQQGDENENATTRARSGESIARVELRHQWSDTLSLRASLEGAYNYLDSHSRLRQGDLDVTPPGSDVRVEEKRAEAGLETDWQPSPQWALELGLNLERSTLSQTGDAAATRHFRHLKPHFAVHWYPSDRTQWHLAVSRKVGQLDFTDFASSASLDTGVISAGNAALEPEKSLRTELGFEHHLQNGGAYTLTWMHDRIDNALDHILIVTPHAIFDAPGNIGAGRRDTLKLDFLFPLDGIGLRHGQIRASLQWQHSRVTDPVTHRPRPISGEKPVDGDITLSQDLSAWRLQWGVTLEHIAERKPKYRYDQVEHEREGTGWTLFVEHRINTRWRVRAEATDLFGRRFHDDRSKYDGPRSTSPLREIERRTRVTPGYVSLTFRYSMGNG